MGEGDLRFIEKLIAAVENHYQGCLKLIPGKRRAQCFYHLSTPIVDLEKGARWISAPEVSLLNKAKFGTLYNSVATLIAHLSLIAEENVQQFKNRKLEHFKMHGYRKAIENALRMLYDYDISVINWRVDAISTATICEIKEKFWKEFIGDCETRWRRSISAEDKLPERGILNGNQTDDMDNESTNMEKDDLDVVSLEDEYELTEEDSISHVADRIGKSWSITNKKFRAQIFDDVKKQVVFEEYIYADSASTNGILHEVTKKAQQARDVATSIMKRKITNFVKDTFAVNWKLLKNTFVLIPQ